MRTPGLRGEQVVPIPSFPRTISGHGVLSSVVQGNIVSDVWPGVDFISH